MVTVIDVWCYSYDELMVKYPRLHYGFEWLMLREGSPHGSPHGGNKVVAWFLVFHRPTMDNHGGVNHFPREIMENVMRIHHMSQFSACCSFGVKCDPKNVHSWPRMLTYHPSTDDLVHDQLWSMRTRVCLTPFSVHVSDEMGTPCTKPLPTLTRECHQLTRKSWDLEVIPNN